MMTTGDHISSSGAQQCGNAPRRWQAILKSEYAIDTHLIRLGQAELHISDKIHYNNINPVACDSCESVVSKTVLVMSLCLFDVKLQQFFMKAQICTNRKF